MQLVCEVAAGQGVGLGHCMRSLELARAFRSSLSAEVAFVVAPGTFCGEHVAAEGFGVDEDPPGADIWVADLPREVQTSSKAFERGGAIGVLAALDYFAYRAPFPDVIVNLFNHGGPPPDRHQVIYEEGIRFAIIRGSLQPLRTVGGSLAPDRSNLLITFGGSDPQEHTLRALEAVRDMASSWDAVDVIVGPHFAEPLREEIEKTSWAVPHTGISCFEGQAERARVAVAGGGTTMLELMFLGIPAVILPQTPAEERFAAEADRSGGVRALSRDASRGEIREAVAAVAGSSELARSLSRGGRKLVDGRGAERIVEVISRALQEKRAGAG